METKTPPTILPEGYYLDNQERVLRFVVEAHSSLLAPHEQLRAEDFLRLSLPARRLYTRLYSRRGPLFLLSSLSYSEIPGLEEAAIELSRAGFVALLSTPVDASEALLLFTLFTREQLLPIVKKRFGSMVNKLKKEQLLQALLDYPDDWKHLSHERFVIVLDEHIFSLFEVLFFGNRHQSLTDFILVDIARIKYYPYAITSVPIFSSRSALAQYLQSAQLLQKASELTTKEEAMLLLEALSPLLAASPPLPSHQRMVDPRRYLQRAAFLSARECERHDERSLARDTYQALSTIDAEPHTQAESIDRFGLLCKRENDSAAFESLCQSAITHGSLDALSMFQVETRRAKLGLGEDPKRSLRDAPVVSFQLTPMGHQGAKAMYQGEAGEPLSVELATLERLGGDGLWSENGLWLTLFGVLFWDAIFAPISGVFVQPFQAGPQDLWSDSFYERRQPLFEDLFQMLGADVLSVLERNHRKYVGYACHFTLWDAYPLALLRRVAEGLGPKLLPIMRRIAQNPGRHSNGLPDLVVFDAEGLYLVEVKGPGDTLRLAQRLWHDYLLKVGVRVRLAKIVTPKAEKPAPSK